MNLDVITYVLTGFPTTVNGSQGGLLRHNKIQSILYPRDLGVADYVFSALKK